MGSDVHCHFQFPVNTIFTISTLAMLGIFLVPGISPVQCQSLNGFVMASLVGVAAADDDEPTADGCCSGGEAGGGDGGSGSHVCVWCVTPLLGLVTTNIQSNYHCLVLLRVEIYSLQKQTKPLKSLKSYCGFF